MITKWIKDSREICNRAEKDPWVVGVTIDHSIYGGWPVFRLAEMDQPHNEVGQELTARFIAESRTRLPLALKALERAVHLIKSHPYIDDKALLIADIEKILTEEK